MFNSTFGDAIIKMRRFRRKITVNESYEFFNISLLVVAFSLAVLATSIAVSILILDLNHFVGITDFYDEQIVVGSKTLVLPCTNLSLGDDEKTFSGDTFLFSTCPTSENECSEFICTEDRYCEQRTISGSSCYQNAQCGNSSRCDLDSCECVSDYPVCLIDSDCGVYNSNPCVEKKCISGQCVVDLISGAECGSTSNCGSGFSCSSNCTCIQNPQQGGYNNFDITITPGIGSFYDKGFPFIVDSVSPFAQWSDYGNYIQMDVFFTATSNSTFPMPFGGYLWIFCDSPVLLEDPSNSMVGIVTLNPIYTTRNITGLFFGSGDPFIFSSNLISLFVQMNNYHYIGPPIETQYTVSVSLIGKKL